MLDAHLEFYRFQASKIQESRAIAVRTARCHCIFRYVAIQPWCYFRRQRCAI